MKYNLITLVVIMILEDSSFSSTSLVSLFCAWNITTVEISSDVFTYLKLNPPSPFVYFRWSWSCYFGLGLKNLVLFTSLPGLRADGACCPLPKNLTPLSTFGLDFWPFGPHSAATSSSLHFPQCIGVLIKTLIVPIFGTKECIRTQDFVLKIYKKIRGS